MANLPDANQDFFEHLQRVFQRIRRPLNQVLERIGIEPPEIRRQRRELRVMLLDNPEHQQLIEPQFLEEILRVEPEIENMIREEEPQENIILRVQQRVGRQSLPDIFMLLIVIIYIIWNVFDSKAFKNFELFLSRKFQNIPANIVNIIGQIVVEISRNALQHQALQHQEQVFFRNRSKQLIIIFLILMLSFFILDDYRRPQRQRRRVQDMTQEELQQLEEELIANAQAQLRQDRKSTRLNSSHVSESRMPSSA